MPMNMNLRTSTPTSNNDAIIANGGFTHYIVMYPTHSGSGWSRPWGYWDTAKDKAQRGYDPYARTDKAHSHWEDWSWAIHDKEFKL